MLVTYRRRPQLRESRNSVTCVFVYYAHILFLRETKCADFVNKQVFGLHIEITIDICVSNNNVSLDFGLACVK